MDPAPSRRTGCTVTLLVALGLAWVVWLATRRPTGTTVTDAARRRRRRGPAAPRPRVAEERWAVNVPRDLAQRRPLRLTEDVVDVLIRWCGVFRGPANPFTVMVAEHPRTDLRPILARLQGSGRPRVFALAWQGTLPIVPPQQRFRSYVPVLGTPFYDRADHCTEEHAGWMAEAGAADPFGLVNEPGAVSVFEIVRWYS